MNLISEEFHNKIIAYSETDKDPFANIKNILDIKIYGIWFIVNLKSINIDKNPENKVINKEVININCDILIFSMSKVKSK